MKQSTHSAAPMTERFAALLAGREAHFTHSEAAQVEPLFVKHFRHVVRVETCGLVRFRQHSIDFRTIPCNCVKCAQ